MFDVEAFLFAVDAFQHVNELRHGIVFQLALA